MLHFRLDIPVCVFFCLIRTIQGKEEDALKIIGKKAYNELESTIFNLLDQQLFKTSSSHKFSNLVHNDTIQKTASVKVNELERSLVPPYRGKTYRDVIGSSPGGRELEYDPDGENAEKIDTRSGGDEEERELLRVQEKMNLTWLYRENRYKEPAQKLSLEREWMEKRRLLLLNYEEKKEQKEREAAKRKVKEKLILTRNQQTKVTSKQTEKEREGVRRGVKEREREGERHQTVEQKCLKR